MSLIEFDRFSFAYPERPACLTEISETVDAGDVLLLVGPAASGKSSLLRTIPGLIPHSTGGTCSGTVRTAGRETRTSEPSSFAGTVGFIHQDPGEGFIADSVDAELRFGLVQLGLREQAILRRLDEVTDLLALGALRGRRLTECSGGERQRVALACALAMAPTIVLADEPTGALDPGAADDFIDALHRMNEDLGTTLVIAEHRLERFLPRTVRAMHLENGRAIIKGALAEIVSDIPCTPAIVQLAERRGWPELPRTVRDAQRLASADPDLVATPSKEPQQTPGERVLRASDLTVSLRAHAAPAIEGATFDVFAGTCVGLLGRNGAGKTTLLRAVAEIVPRSRGTIECAPGIHVGYVTHDPSSLFTEATVRAELRRTRAIRKLPDSPEIVDRWLHLVRLVEAAERPAATLSGGQRIRAAIATIGVAEVDILALDEPTRGLDGDGKAVLHDVVEYMRRRGGSVLIATHDLELIAEVADRILVLSGGHLVDDGPPRELLTTGLLRPAIGKVVPNALTLLDIPQVSSASPPATHSMEVER